MDSAALACNRDMLVANDVLLRPEKVRKIFRTKSFDHTLLEAPFHDKGAVYDVGRIGAYSYIGGRDSVIKRTASIGRFCAIAGDVNIGAVEHPTQFLSSHMMFEGGMDRFWPSLTAFYKANAGMIERAATTMRRDQREKFPPIVIGDDVWIGESAYIRQGVTIGSGAIVAARAVVIKDVSPYAIVAGVPAKVVRFRFEPAAIAELLRLNWWSYGLSALDGVDFTDIDQALAQIDLNIRSGRAALFKPNVFRVEKSGLIFRHEDRAASSDPASRNTVA